MNRLFLLGYIIVSCLLLWILNKDELLLTFSPRRRSFVFAACLVIPALFFVPYVFDFMPSNIEVPDWLYWLPFLLLALVGTVIQLFFPQQVTKLTPVMMFSIFGVILFLNLLPLLLSALSILIGGDTKWTH